MNLENCFNPTLLSRTTKTTHHPAMMVLLVLGTRLRLLQTKCYVAPVVMSTDMALLLRLHLIAPSPAWIHQTDQPITPHQAKVNLKNEHSIPRKTIIEIGPFSVMAVYLRGIPLVLCLHLETRMRSLPILPETMQEAYHPKCLTLQVSLGLPFNETIVVHHLAISHETTDHLLQTSTVLTMVTIGEATEWNLKIPATLTVLDPIAHTHLHQMRLEIERDQFLLRQDDHRWSMPITMTLPAGTAGPRLRRGAATGILDSQHKAINRPLLLVVGKTIVTTKVELIGIRLLIEKGMIANIHLPHPHPELGSVPNAILEAIREVCTNFAFP